MRRVLQVLVCVVCMLASLGAAAQDDAKDQARLLATEAGELLDAKEYKKALKRLKKAEKLYHAPTHVVMIGEAYEGLGRLTKALAAYEKVAAEPLPQGSPPAFVKAQNKAKERIVDLNARVPSLLIKVTGPGAGAATATVDGEEVSLTSGTAVRLDPGRHKVTVSADGYRRVERSVKLKEKGGVKILEIELTPAGGTADTSDPDPDPLPDPDTTDAEDATGDEPWLVPSIVAFGLGGAAVIVGAITGSLTLSKVGDLEDACENKVCNPTHQDDIDEIETLGNVSTAMFVVGGVGVATAIVLLVAWPAAIEDSEEASIQPIVGPGGIGVRGTF